MTYQGFDGVIRGVDEGAGRRFGEEDEADDPLRGVRDMLDRLYADEGGSESEYIEMISQILLTATAQAMEREGLRP